MSYAYVNDFHVESMASLILQHVEPIDFYCFTNIMGFPCRTYQFFKRFVN